MCMDVFFGPFIGGIGLTEEKEKMKRKRNNLHILKCL